MPKPSRFSVNPVYPASEDVGKLHVVVIPEVDIQPAFGQRLMNGIAGEVRQQQRQADAISQLPGNTLYFHYLFHIHGSYLFSDLFIYSEEKQSLFFSG